MTPTAAIITYVVMGAVVLGLLKWLRKGLQDRKTLVVPDEQAYHTRIISLRSPKKKKKRA